MQSPRVKNPEVAHESAPLRRIVDGRYELVRSLGVGGMSDVWLAWDLRLKDYCAVKELRGGLAGHGMFRERFVREAHVMRKLKHVHIVTVHDLIHGDNGHVLVMELMSRGSLADWVKRDTCLPPRIAVGITQKVLAALALAHRHHVVHRDVKPANILIDIDGSPKLADFGIAHLADRSGPTRTGQQPGTLDYMPPEQELGIKVDARSDVYAVGATLYNLLCGANPGRLYMEDERSDRWIDIPEALRPVLIRATRREPDDRYQSAVAMCEALDGVVPVLPPAPPRYALPPEVTLPDLDVEFPAMPQKQRTPTLVPSIRPFVGLAGLISDLKQWGPVLLVVPVGVMAAFLWIYWPDSETAVPERSLPDAAHVAGTAGPSATGEILDIDAGESVAGDADVLTDAGAPSKVAGVTPVQVPPNGANIRSSGGQTSTTPESPLPVRVTLTATASASVQIEGAGSGKTDPLGNGSRFMLVPGIYNVRFDPESEFPRGAKFTVPNGVNTLTMHCDLTRNPPICLPKSSAGRGT